MKPILVLLCALTCCPPGALAQTASLTNRILLPKTSVRRPAVQLEKKPADPRDLKELRGTNDRFVPPLQSKIPPVQMEQAAFPKALDLPPSSLAKSSQAVARARAFQTRGDFTNAFKSYEAAKTEALASRDREGAGFAALNTARTLQAGLAVQAVDPSLRPLMVSNYELAISNAAPPQQALARNNLATLYLKDRKPREAAQLLRQVDWSSVDPNEEHFCRYNLGKAEELIGNGGAAFEQYRLAISKQPRYEPAVRSAFRLLMASSNVTAIATLAEDLAERKEAASAARHLRTALGRFAHAPNAERLISALAYCHVQMRTTPPDYQPTDQTFLDTIAARAPRLAPMITQLHRAFAADVSPTDYRQAFAAWTGASTTLSKVLLGVGNFHSRPEAESPGPEPYRKALNCYMAAWMFDLSNTEAALYAASLMLEKRALLDPQGSGITELTHRLFQQKGAGYAVPVKTHRDWLNLLPLHLVLATVYEKMGRWGSENDAECAIFQLYRAVQIEDLLRRGDPEFVASPATSQRLARAYRSANRPEDAWQQYLKAAEGFVFYQQAGEAKKSLAEARALPLAANLARTERWNLIQNQCNRLENP